MQQINEVSVWLNNILKPSFVLCSVFLKQSLFVLFMQLWMFLSFLLELEQEIEKQQTQNRKLENTNAGMLQSLRRIVKHLRK